MSTRGRYGVRLMVALALNYGNGITLLRDVSRRKGSPKVPRQIIIP
jgi:DNA-binding IscR family transcriptional regulator